MLALSIRHQIIIGSILMVLMIITRSHHFAAMHTLPGASWVVFFLAGVYLRSALPLLGFFVLTWILDFAAYASGDGVSDYCLTYAYAFLMPAYASLWLAGRWYAYQYQFTWRTLQPLLWSMTAGLVLCELFSSGGFYFFSDRFANTTLIEFSQRVISYFPLYVGSFLFYIMTAIIIHSVVKVIDSIRDLRQSANG